MDSLWVDCAVFLERLPARCAELFAHVGSSSWKAPWGSAVLRTVLDCIRKCHGSSGQRLAVRQTKTRRMFSGWQQWHTLAKKDRHNANLNRIHQTGIKQAAKQTAAPKEPNVLAGFCFQGSHRP